MRYNPTALIFVLSLATTLSIGMHHADPSVYGPPDATTIGAHRPTYVTDRTRWAPACSVRWPVPAHYPPLSECTTPSSYCIQASSVEITLKSSPLYDKLKSEFQVWSSVQNLSNFNVLSHHLHLNIPQVKKWISGGKFCSKFI